MSSHKADRVARVLAGAVRVWAVAARVERDPQRPDAIVVRAPSGVMHIVPAAPHGWLVRRDGRVLSAHAGLPGLLRTLRDEL